MRKSFLLFLVLPFLTAAIFSSHGPEIWTTSLSGAGQIWTTVINSSTPSTMYAGSVTTGVWKTTNSGLNWVQSNSGLTNLTIQCMQICVGTPSVIYAGTSQTGAGAGVYRSTDAGATWTLINTGIVETSVAIQSIAVHPTNPLIAYIAVFDGLVDSPQGIYKTTNGGTSWVPANTGIGTVKNFLSLSMNPKNPNTLYAGTSFNIATQMGPSKIYKTVDGAATWIDVSNGLPSATTDNKPIRCLSISTLDTAVVLAGMFMNTDSVSGMFLTGNGGANWVRMHTGLPNAVGTLPRSCIIKPGSATEFFVGLGNAGNSGIGVWKTTDGGRLWTDFNGGTLSNTTSIRNLNFKNAGSYTLYAGGAHPTLTTGQGVFEYTFTATGIGNNNEVPDRFFLSQNYPNPFNPVTKIKYSLLSSQFVTLIVYDLSGKEITTLVNNSQVAGNYEVDFDASSLSTGVYIYRISAGTFLDEKKMMLVK